MKKLFIAVLILITLGLDAAAQIKVEDIKREADTLMFTFSSGMEVVNVYKNTNGYFLADESTNQFDPKYRFYLGKDKCISIKSLESLILLCDEDVKTTATIIDAEGNKYLLETNYGIGNYKRKTTPQKSNMIWIKNDHMAGWISYRKKTLEELKSLLSK